MTGLPQVVLNELANQIGHRYPARERFHPQRLVHIFWQIHGCGFQQAVTLHLPLYYYATVMAIHFDVRKPVFRSPLPDVAALTRTCFILLRWQPSRWVALVKFLSLEPLLGPVGHLGLDGIDWVIVGGESGPGARPMAAAWVAEIRDRCVAPYGRRPPGWGRVVQIPR